MAEEEEGGQIAGIEFQTLARAAADRRLVMNGRVLGMTAWSRDPHVSLVT